MRQITFRLLLAASTLAIVAPAAAQTAGAPPEGANDAPVTAETTAPNSDAATDVGGIGDIIVMARRREESLQNVPLSVTGISAATIEQKDITSVERLNGLAPGMFIVQATGPSTSAVVLNIRGVGGSDSTGVSDYPVATYVDGVLVSRPNSLLFDLVDLERVEVLRGPQGTLFGRNTIGGAINIFTAKPADTARIEEKVTYGSYDLFKARTTLDTGELGDSGVYAKLAYSHEEFGGFVKNEIKTRSANPGARNTDSLFLAIHADASPAFTADFKADYSNGNNSVLYQQLAIMAPTQLAYFSQSAALGGDPLVIDPNFRKRARVADQPRGNLEIYGGALTLNYEISDALSLKSITGYRRYKEQQAINNGGQGVLRGRLVDGSIGRVFLFDYPEPVRASDKQFTQEFQAAGDIADFNYVLGLYYFDQTYGSRTPQRLTSVLNVGGQLRGFNVAIIRDYEQEAKSYAAFGQVSWTPASIPGLEITGGLRYTHDKKRLAQANFSNGVAQTPGLGRNSWNNTSYLASANYRFSPEFLVYGRVSSAYRAGGFDAGGAGNPNTYNPEKATAYEAGFKADLFDRRLRFNVSGYITDYTDLQISQFLAGTNGGRTQTVNAGKATFSGFEAEATALITPDFTINGAIGYVHPNYKQYLFLNPANNQLINVADEVKLAHVPKTTWNVGAGWDAYRWNDTTLNLRVDFAHQSGADQFPLDRVNPFNDFIRQNPWDTLSARITLQDLDLGDGLRVNLQVFGDNLLDDEQRINSVEFGSLGFATVAYGPDRRFGVTATVRY